MSDSPQSLCGIGREIAGDEAMSIIAQNQKQGLVLQPAKEIFVIDPKFQGSRLVGALVYWMICTTGV